ncbi:hypothetical protein [Streptomyces sp. 1222.5]
MAVDSTPGPTLQEVPCHHDGTKSFFFDVTAYQVHGPHRLEVSTIRPIA